MARDGEPFEVGQTVKHKMYGTGRVVQVESQKKQMLIWVEFDRGDVKTLGVTDPPVLRPRRWYDVTTRPVPSIRCDICGVRPVVLSASMAGEDLSVQRCAQHEDLRRFPPLWDSADGE